MVIIRIFFLETKYKESELFSVSVGNHIEALIFIVVNYLLNALYLKVFVEIYAAGLLGLSFVSFLKFTILSFFFEGIPPLRGVENGLVIP